MKSPRIYLDNAATSWPKPSVVYDAVDDYQRRLGVAVGRGGYAAANEVAELVETSRQRIADLIHAGSASQVIFTFNCTDALNLAIHGILRGDDHVVTSTAEHNSVLRPLRWLEDRGAIRVTRVPCDSTGWVDPDGIRAAIRTDTKLIALTHVSNVTGTIQPINEVAQLAQDRGVLFLLDAAQSLGHMHVSVKQLGIDLLVAAGHKGLMGPLGTGLLYIRDGLESLVDCVRQGGTGSASFDDHQPLTLPSKYESGNPNAPGLVGLGAAVSYLVQRGVDSIEEYEHRLSSRLIEGFAGTPGVKIHGVPANGRRLGVVSIPLSDRRSIDMAAMLDRRYGIQVRAGYHCAALIHDALGTRATENTVRFSVGPFNTEEDVERAVEAVDAIARAASPTIASPTACACVAAASLPSRDPATETARRAYASVSEIPGMSELWELTLGDPRVVIAVLDGAVDLSQSCFDGADLTYLPTVVPAAAESGRDSRHGTRVAGLIFGQHDSPLKGIAPRCRGIIVPIFRDRDDGSIAPCSQTDLARALLMAAEAGAHIINISGGEFSPSGTAHPILADAVSECADRGILIVAAAGNQGCRCLHIPGAIPSVLAVGAMDPDGEPYAYSNWGYGTQGILAPMVGEGDMDHSGTSFVAPIVSGIAGLFLSLQAQRGMHVSTMVVRDAILTSAAGCEHKYHDDCDRLLAGRLKLSAALELITQGVAPMAGPQTDNVDNRDSGAEDYRSPAKAEPLGATEQIKNQTGVMVSSGSTASPASAGQNSSMARQSEMGPTTEGGPAHSSGVSGVSGFAAPSTLDVGVVPSACGCGGNGGASQKVFALGKLSFDYGSRARRSYFADSMQKFFSPAPPAPQIHPNIDDPGSLIRYLRSTDKEGKYQILDGARFKHRTEVASIIWTLMIDETPIYAIVPNGPFAFKIQDQTS